eukprot:TRINITY_DN76910_c0_g1_i1.p1 TRINITY_DN76910_c0_g1~~TRINITY_DN76910_c0_g1_i1.p1  ORF type:complete len:181 (+),score=33.12 TRINITY_DN76910_c0_g1_i1:59-601(+)
MSSAAKCAARFLIRYRFSGGGPAPLLDNPSVGLCVIIMIMSVASWAFSGLALLRSELRGVTCAADVRGMLLGVVLLSAINGMFKCYMSFKVRACDFEWTAICWSTLAINGSQIFLLVWTAMDFVTILTSCFQTDVILYLVLTLGWCLYCATVTLDVLGFYSLFLPSFALQFRKLGKLNFN